LALNTTQPARRPKTGMFGCRRVHLTIITAERYLAAGDRLHLANSFQIVGWTTASRHASALAAVFALAHEGGSRTDLRQVSQHRHFRAGAGRPARQRWPYAYGSAPWSVPLKALKPLDLDHSQFTFVDIGSGKGRVVLAASTLPFARVIGVEFSPPLCRIAERNLVTSRYVRRRAGQVGIVETNAAAFAVPDTPCVYYFYNPLSFDLMDIVINDIVKSYRTDRRKIYLICVGMSSIIQKIMVHRNLQILHAFEVKTGVLSKASVFILMAADD
jgi:hypothetical protein